MSECAYLCVNGEWHFPAIRRDDLGNAVFLRLFAYAIDVLDRVLELLRGRAIRRRFLQAEHAIWFWRRVVGRAVVSALDRGEIQRLCLASAQRNRHDAVRLRARNRWHRNSAHSRSRCRRCAILRSAVPANSKGGDGGTCRRPSLGHKVDHDTFAAAPGATTKSAFEMTL
jgi:hypothetical protein